MRIFSGILKRPSCDRVNQAGNEAGPDKSSPPYVAVWSSILHRVARNVLQWTHMLSHFTSPSIAMGMSKLAMNRFNKFLAATYEAEGLMSYALRPGSVKTRMSTDPEKVPARLSESEFSAGQEKYLRSS